MSKGFESFAGEVREQIKDIKSRMPQFFDNMKINESSESESKDNKSNNDKLEMQDKKNTGQDVSQKSDDDSQKDTHDSQDDFVDENSTDISQLSETEKQQKIQDFLDGKISFDEVKAIFAERYADAVNSNQRWTWSENIPNGDMLSAGQKAKIRDYAIENGMIPVAEIRIENGKTYADFSRFKVYECTLSEDKWKESDQDQFNECNKQLKEAIANNPELRSKFTEEQLAQIEKGETPSGYTWHHSEKDGRMELVPFGVHNSTYHSGGRSEGNWADAPRQ